MKVKIVTHGQFEGGEIADKEWFAIGTVHEVIDYVPELGVYLRERDGEPYFLVLEEVEEVNDSITLGGTGC